MDVGIIKSARGAAPLRASKAVRAAMRKRGKNPGNLTYFYGAKVDRDWVLPSDIELSRALYSDCDPDITWYTCDPDTIGAKLAADHYEGSKPDQIIERYRSGRGLVEVKSTGDQQSARALKQKRVQTQYAEKIGATWEWWSEKDAHEHRRELMNWLQVTSVLSEYRRVDTASPARAVDTFLRHSSECTLLDLRENLNLPWALVFVAVMRMHTKRQVIVDLSSQELAWRSMVKLP